MPSPEDCGVLTGLREAVDAVREELERTWGVGRLELLAGAADPNLLARFRRQEASWSVALQTAWAADPVTADQFAVAQAKAAAMQRAWRALEAHAAEAGRRPIAPWVWETPLGDGTVAAFVQTEAEVGAVLSGGRYLRVFTPADIGRLIDALPEALRISDRHAQEARTVAPKQAVTNTLGAPPFDPKRGDDIPFGGPQQAPVEDDFPSAVGRT